MIIYLLAFWHRLTLHLANVWNTGLNYVRQKLGPPSISFWLCDDGQVIPSTITLPPAAASNAYLFDPNNNRLTHFLHLGHDGRHRSLNIIAANFEHPTIGRIDISDWIGEIRAHPTPDLHIRQLITLWSHVHNHYVPQNGGVSVCFTKNDGETQYVTFD